MNKSELVEAVAERAGSDRAVARRHVDALLDTIIDSVAAGERVLVTGFGTFERAARPARTVRNPRTGRTVEVAAGEVPRFRFGQTFRNRVAQSGGAAPAATAATAPASKQAPAESAEAKALVAEPEKHAKGKGNKKKGASDKKARKEAKGPKNAKKGKAAKGGKKGSGKKAKAR